MQLNYTTRRRRGTSRHARSRDTRGVVYAAIHLAANWGDGANALACPCCQHPYLHHGAVTVYDRDQEDAEIVVVTVVDGGVTRVKLLPSAHSGNPSRRRDGLAIRFLCEDCQTISELTCEQHKGRTFLAWRPGSEISPAASTGS